MKLAITHTFITAPALVATLCAAHVIARPERDRRKPQVRGPLTEVQTSIPTVLPTSSPLSEGDENESSTVVPTSSPLSEGDEEDDDQTQNSVPSCITSFTVSTYESIEEDISALMNSIADDESRAHFIGGIVRLVAHDFMDYDPTSSTRMGQDGCFDFEHPNNAGLETIWCDRCELTLLRSRKYSHISRADFFG